MGMTLTEKILALHGDKDKVVPGEELHVGVDRVLLDEQTFYQVVKQAEKENRKAPPNNHQKIAVAMDQFIPASNEMDPEVRGTVREYSRLWHIYNLYKLGLGGLENNIFPDGGLVRPGDLILTANPERRAFGAIGALVYPSTVKEIVAALWEGKIKVRVPQTLRLNFNGALKRWVGGKDLAFAATQCLDPETIKDKAVEFGGDAIKELDVPERLALGAAAAGLYGAQLLVEPDEKTRIFARARSDRFFRGCRNEDEARFADTFEMDCNKINALVAFPYQEKKTKAANAVKKRKIDQIIIGGDGNGRIEDLRKAAALLREYQVKNRVRLILIPGSQQAYLHAMEEGLIQIFVRSGAHVGPPSQAYADQCHTQGISRGEVCLSTSARIYSQEETGPGKEIIYCNPQVAAASAVLGIISDPFEMMRTTKRMSTGIVR